VTSVVPDADVLAKATETAQTLAQKPLVAVKASKELMKRPIRAQLEEAVNREVEVFAVCVRSRETKEAINAFFQKKSHANVV
jgi:enoyl-CoA hydratase/carnithine racemase